MSAVTAAGNVVRFAARRLVARARWVINRVFWVVKVAQKKAKGTLHAVRLTGEGIRDRAVNAYKAVYRWFRRPVRRAERRYHHLQERYAFHKIEWGIEKEIETIVARDRTLIVGPWLSEVGFETLYWIPFLHWMKAAFHIDPDRVVAVSRGGVGSWYQGVASRYVEMWSAIDPVEFSRRNAQRPLMKQYEPSALDHEVLDALAPQIGTRDFDVLHPGLMYRLFMLYWSGQRAMGFMDARTKFTRVTPPAIIDPGLLPPEYIAVKFYAARSLPDTPRIREYLKTTVGGLAERLPVVLLDTGLVLEDDHADYTFQSRGGVMSARSLMTPQNNLGVQTQIIAGAKAFVGTCGSIAWLAPRLGVDTSAVYVDQKFLHAHLAVAMRAYHKLNAGRFATVDLRAIEPIGLGPGVVPGAADPDA